MRWLTAWFGGNRSTTTRMARTRLGLLQMEDRVVPTVVAAPTETEPEFDGSWYDDEDWFPSADPAELESEGSGITVGANGEIDLDGDGRYDGVGVDTNGDGLIDSISMPDRSRTMDSIPGPGDDSPDVVATLPYIPTPHTGPVSVNLDNIIVREPSAGLRLVDPKDPYKFPRVPLYGGKDPLGGFGYPPDSLMREMTPEQRARVPVSARDRQLENIDSALLILDRMFPGFDATREDLLALRGIVAGKSGLTREEFFAADNALQIIMHSVISRRDGGLAIGTGASFVSLIDPTPLSGLVAAIGYQRGGDTASARIELIGAIIPFGLEKLLYLRRLHRLKQVNPDAYAKHMDDYKNYVFSGDGTPPLTDAQVAEAAAAAAPKVGLPPTTEASVADKLDRYLLNPDHVQGGPKAKWFREALGFEKGNAGDLAKQIKFDEAKATVTGVTEHGTKYNQVITIQGANGKLINVTFAWIKNKDGVVRLVTSIPTPR